jgi:epoxyqueuosine reductase QueG
MSKRLGEEIRRKALKWGADLVGFAPVTRFSKYAAEHHPTLDFPKAKTVIILALHMVDPLLDIWLHAPQDSGAGRIETGRAFEDEILRGICYRIALYLERKGHEARVISYEPGLYLKDAAALAGLGVIGKNNLLITSKYGPRVRLRALVTEAEILPDDVVDDNPWCSTCDACIKACPVGALAESGYNRERCLTCSLHRRKISPYAELWCNECANACPVGSKVPSDNTLRIKSP